MARSLLVPFALVWLVTLAGGLIVLGGLASLTNDYQNTVAFPKFEPYRLAWTTWSLEVVALLVALYALFVGPFRHWRGTVVFFYAATTPILIQLTNAVLVAQEGLPGSNSTATRANTTAAGLIIVLIGNYVQAILAALHDTEEPRAASLDGSSGKGVSV